MPNLNPYGGGGRGAGGPVSGFGSRAVTSQNKAARTYVTKTPPNPNRVAAGKRMWDNARDTWYGYGVKAGRTAGYRKGLGKGIAAGAAAGAGISGTVGLAANKGKDNGSSRQRSVKNSTARVKSGKYSGKRVPKGM